MDGPRSRPPDVALVPACLQGLSRYGNDLNNGLLEADYIVVEMARKILGEQWLPEYVARANAAPTAEIVPRACPGAPALYSKMSPGPTTLIEYFGPS